MVLVKDGEDLNRPAAEGMKRREQMGKTEVGEKQLDLEIGGMAEGERQAVTESLWGQG